MKVEFINKTNPQFKQVFDPAISEPDFVLGGIIVTENKQVIGQSILYKNPHYTSPNDKALLFGYFKVPNFEVATLLIKEMEKVAHQNKFNRIIGPINGSTWYNYRLMETFDGNPFLGEEVTPLEYNSFLTLNNFKILKSYTSNLLKSSDYSEEFIAEKEKELKENQWKIRTINKANLSEELFQIAQFANHSFAKNVLFSPIKESDFVAIYTPLMSNIDTQYIRLIEDEKREIKALILAYQNTLNPNELVLKTTGRLPECSIKELGTFLSHKVAQQAYNNGLEKVIHAYLSSDNAAAISQSKFQTHIHRKYHLYFKTLEV